MGVATVACIARLVDRGKATPKVRPSAEAAAQPSEGSLASSAPESGKHAVDLEAPRVELELPLDLPRLGLNGRAAKGWKPVENDPRYLDLKSGKSGTPHDVMGALSSPRKQAVVLSGFTPDTATSEEVVKGVVMNKMTPKYLVDGFAHSCSVSCEVHADGDATVRGRPSSFSGHFLTMYPVTFQVSGASWDVRTIPKYFADGFAQGCSARCEDRVDGDATVRGRASSLSDDQRGAVSHFLSTDPAALQVSGASWDVRARPKGFADGFAHGRSASCDERADGDAPVRDRASCFSDDQRGAVSVSHLLSTDPATFQASGTSWDVTIPPTSLPVESVRMSSSLDRVPPSGDAELSALVSMKSARMVEAASFYQHPCVSLLPSPKLGNTSEGSSEVGTSEVLRTASTTSGRTSYSFEQPPSSDSTSVDFCIRI